VVYYRSNSLFVAMANSLDKFLYCPIYWSRYIHSETCHFNAMRHSIGKDVQRTNEGRVAKNMEASL
jgi:hypothetical protein